MNIFNRVLSQSTSSFDVRQRMTQNPRQNSDVINFAPLMAQTEKIAHQQGFQNHIPNLNTQNISEHSAFTREPLNNKGQYLANEQSSSMQSAVNFANSSLITRSRNAVRAAIAGNTAMPEVMARTAPDADKKMKDNPEAMTTKSVSPPIAATNSNSPNGALQDIATQTTSNGINLNKDDTHAQRSIPLHNTAGIALQKGSIELTGQRAITLDAASLKRLDLLAAKKQKTTKLEQNTEINTSRNTQNIQINNRELGHLAARFESGSTGLDTIGYDRNGGTSYGTYQIASRPGSMERFINYLEQTAPDMATSLKNAGPANTGSHQGAMPEAWRALAKKEPIRLENLQKQFIHDTHYLPALKAVEKEGFVIEDFSDAMKEVLWSTSVQHGPRGAARIFSQAAETVGLRPTKQKEQETKIIEEVYSLRAERFQSSTKPVQQAVRQRMDSEKYLALALYETSLSA